MRACLDFGLIVIFLCFTCVISQQWHSVNSNWDDGSFSSTGGTWNNGGNTGVGMVNAVPWYGGNFQWTYVPFYQMSGMSQRSTVHRWDDGSTTTHGVW